MDFFCIISMNKALKYIILCVIILSGFWFRFQGIRDNHSFWSDEAFVATLARDVLQEKRTMSDALYQYGYQRMHLLTTMGSMKVFGFNEFSARIPSVLFGTASIFVAFLLASALSNIYGGILASFLLAFSQLQLANDTQAKAYSALTLLFLSVLYLLVRLEKKGKYSIKTHVVIIVLSSFATLFHYLGILIWIPYATHIIATHHVAIFAQCKKPLHIIVTIAIAGFLFYILDIGTILGYFFQGGTFGMFLFPVNNMTYFRELLWRHYSFITMAAIVGMFIGVYEKKFSWSIALFVFLLFYCYLWIFKQSTHNIRYIVPLFGIIFVYFCVFWANVATKLFPKHQLLFVLSLILLLYIGGYKIVRKPSTYYSPNADLYGDVQNADYKTFFELLKQRYPDLSNVVVFTDWGDTQHWYLPEKPVQAYFMKRFESEKSEANNIDNVMMYGTVDQFIAEQKKYPKGLVVVEDWVSFFPDEIKEHVKSNLTRELRVESLSQASGDVWPLELYSWGME